jgi:hypothetical protein
MALSIGHLVHAQHSTAGKTSGSSSTQSAQGTLVSEKQAAKMQCLDLNHLSPYRVYVSFNSKLVSEVKRNDHAYILHNGQLLPDSRKNRHLKTGPYCMLQQSSLQKSAVNIALGEIYSVEPTLVRIADSESGHRGCRLNLKSATRDLTSLDCHVPGGGEATLGDIQKAFGKNGSLEVRRIK